MIVVAIIGVVAAIIMPGFIQDMSERINSNRQANIAQKITKSVELMDVNGKTGPNAETDMSGRYYDIRSFKTATFTQHACPGGLIFEKTCILDLGTDYEAIDCTKEENTEYCGVGTYFIDFYAGAHKASDELGLKVPDANEYLTLVSSGKITKAPTVIDNLLQYLNNNGYCTDYTVRGIDCISKSIQSRAICISKY